MEQPSIHLPTLVARQLAVDPARVVPAAHLRDDLGADSLDLFALTRALEGAFGIDIPDADADRIQTVGDIKEYLQRRMDALAPAAPVPTPLERLVAWAQEARGWIQDEELRHRVDDLVPPRLRTPEVQG